MMQNSSIYLVGMSNHIFNLIFKILQYPVVASLCWYVYFKVFLKRTWFCKVNFWLWEISRNGDRIYSFSASYFPISQKSLDQNSSLTALWHNNWKFEVPLKVSLLFIWLIRALFPCKLPKWNTFFLIGIHSMHGWAATAGHRVARKRSTKRLKHAENLFRKELQLTDVY